MELILKHKCTLFDVLTKLMHYFVLFFSILSQKEKFYVNRKNNTQSNCIIFFRILSRIDIYFTRPIIYQSGITMHVSDVICYNAIQSSI